MKVGIEAIEITRNLLGDLSNAWKYGMRYEDKNTPKKDVMKLHWYLSDFRNHFIDINNECTANVSVPPSILDKMKVVIDTEPVAEIKRTFELIFSIVKEGGLVNPSEYDNVLVGLETYSATLN